MAGYLDPLQPKGYLRAKTSPFLTCLLLVWLSRCTFTISLIQATSSDTTASELLIPQHPHCDTRARTWTTAQHGRGLCLVSSHSTPSIRFILNQTTTLTCSAEDHSRCVLFLLSHCFSPLHSHSCLFLRYISATRESNVQLKQTIVKINFNRPLTWSLVFSQNLTVLANPAVAYKCIGGKLRQPIYPFKVLAQRKINPGNSYAVVVRIHFRNKTRMLNIFSYRILVFGYAGIWII